MSPGDPRRRISAGPDWSAGALALLLACGPQAPPEMEEATAASASASTSSGGSGTTTGADANPIPVTTSGTDATPIPVTTSGTGTGTDSTTTDMGTDVDTTTEAPPWAPIACETDEFEANDEAMVATPVDMPCRSLFRTHWQCLAELTACHGLGDEDWYALPAAPEATDWTVLHLELDILPAIGGCNCGGDPIPMGPELASTIEVFDAQTLMLIGSASGMDPHIWLYDSGPQFGQALLIRVVGPADVSWTYELWMYRQDSTWEDSCEC